MLNLQFLAKLAKFSAIISLSIFLDLSSFFLDSDNTLDLLLDFGFQPIVIQIEQSLLFDFLALSLVVPIFLLIPYTDLFLFRLLYFVSSNWLFLIYFTSLLRLYMSLLRFSMFSLFPQLLLKHSFHDCLKIFVR